VNALEESKQILIAITDLQANVRNLVAEMDKLSKISTLAMETDQRAKSAHNRIDELKKDYEDKIKAQKEDYEEKIADQKANLKELKDHITWLWRSVGGGAITLVFGVILFFITRGGN
jgi:hypothetical protein